MFMFYSKYYFCFSRELRPDQVFDTFWVDDRKNYFEFLKQFSPNEERTVI